jgi:hypothetical protein
MTFVERAGPQADGPARDLRPSRRHGVRDRLDGLDAEGVGDGL